MIRRLVIATLVVLPSVSFGQRGGRTQADKQTPLFDKQEMAKGPDIRVRDIEDQSPLHLLIDKRKDLKLTDAQLSQLKDADGKLREKSAPLYKAVDSLIHDMRITSTPSDQDRMRARNARAGLMDVLKSVNENYDAFAKGAVALLDADQQAKANEMLDKQRQDGEKFVRERLNAAGKP